MALKKSTPQYRTLPDVSEASRLKSPNPSSKLLSQSSTPGTNENIPLTIPLSAYYIIFVEGCERFCYFGLRAVLLLYFMYFLGFDKDSATVCFHLFIFASYFTPIFGAILSDGFIGRYLTLLLGSIVYFIGTVVLTITAVPQIGHKHLLGPAIGLLLIAVGTGGVKPCVNTFGADQILTLNSKQLNRYYSIFYFSISTGSFASMVITPLLRSQVQCFGYDCYSLAFGVPSLVMLIAIVIFIVGTPLYKRIPPKENIIAQFIAIIWRATRNAIFGPSTSEPKENWLYYANDKYSKKDIEDVRCVLRIFLIFSPLPIYHALHDQEGSRWTYQASLMDGSLGPFGTIQPDQMQGLSSFLVLLFIPFFNKVIYPAAARFNLLIKPLQKIYVAMIFMVFAFVAAAIVQQAIDTKGEVMPVRHYTNIYNGYDCSVNINSNQTLVPGKVYQYPCTELLTEKLFVSSNCDENILEYELSADKICPSVLIIYKVNETMHGKEMGLTTLTNPITRTRGVQGFALLRMVSLDDGNRTVEISPNHYKYNIENKLIPTEYQSVLASSYRIENVTTGEESIDSFNAYRTGVYTVLLVSTNDNKLHTILFEDVPPFTVHMLWQSIQYVFLTSADVFLNINCLIFAYSQAPNRYKVVIMSAWLFTTAVGNLLVVLIAGVHFAENQVMEFVFFAVLMAFATFIFGVIAINYKEVPSDELDNDIREDDQLLMHKKIPLETQLSFPY